MKKSNTRALAARKPQTKLQRQDAALAELDDDFEFPLFNGRQAVESQRKSGYKNTPRAARAIIDNSYEAEFTHHESVVCSPAHFSLRCWTCPPI